MTRLDEAGASVVQQERLLDEIPGGSVLATGWSMLSRDEKQTEMIKYNKHSQLIQTQRQ